MLPNYRNPQFIQEMNETKMPGPPRHKLAAYVHRSRPEDEETRPEDEEKRGSDTIDFYNAGRRYHDSGDMHKAYLHFYKGAFSTNTHPLWSACCRVWLYYLVTSRYVPPHRPLEQRCWHMMNRDIPLLEAEHRYDYEWAISYVLACELFPQKISLLPHAAFSLTEFIVQQYGFLANVCNCTMAQYRLGLLYLSGRLEIPPDPDEARQLFHLAAAQGFVPAQEKLSELGL